MPDSALVAYGLLSAGARAVLPPIVDLPVVRAVRGAMLDRLARAAGVTLTADARRVLVDVDEPTSAAGVAEQAVRWAAGRFIPGAAAIDGARNALRTFGAGALFRRYLDAHRPEPRDPVISGVEAERIHRAMRDSMRAMSVEQLRAVARVAMGAVQKTGEASDKGIVQRYSDAFVAALAEAPAAWLGVLDDAFAKSLDAPKGAP